MSRTSEKVSCVITCYNYGRYVGQAIASVLAQSRRVDEIVVIDDGSTDDSVKVVGSFGDQVRLIQQANQGVVVARNRGAAEVDGQWLFFLDADDTLAPQFVAELMAAMESSGAALAYCDWQFTGQTHGSIAACPWNPRKLLYRNYIIPAALMRRAAFDEVGGYSQKLNQPASFEDWDLWLSMVDHNKQGMYVPQTLFCYRLHGAGRNVPALAQRPAMESQLRKQHPALYNDPVNRAYLAFFGTASRIRNALVRAPGRG